MQDDNLFDHIRQPRRPHYIEAWARSRNLKQTDLARELDVDKSLVSRWFAGTTPGAEWQRKLAMFFGCQPESLFRHPDEEWVFQFLVARSPAEIDRIKKVLELAFPRITDN